MTTIDEQIAQAKHNIKSAAFYESESIDVEKAVLASLERLKKIDAVQVPDEPMHVDLTRRSLQYVTPPTTASVRSYRQDKELIDYIDTLRDLLRREIADAKHYREKSDLLSDAAFQSEERAEAAESKLADEERENEALRKDAERLKKLFEYWEEDDKEKFCALIAEIRKDTK